MRSLPAFLLALLVLIFVHQAVCQSNPSAAKSPCEAPNKPYPEWSKDQNKWVNDVFLPSIQKRVASRWFTSQLFGVPPGIVCVEFDVQLNGTITGAKIFRSSHSDLLDQSALRAVEIASPVGPLLNDLPVKFMHVNYKFDYRIKVFASNYALLSELPNTIKESEDVDFPVLVSFQPSFVDPLQDLKTCCLDKWVQSVEQHWISLASSSNDKNLVEIEAEIEPDGSVSKLQISKSSGNGRIDRAAVDSLSSTQLTTTLTIKEPVKIRAEFLTHQTPDDILTTTTF